MKDSESVSHSVMPDSLQPHGLQSNRLLCPWDFPGKNTGVGCHCLLRLHAIAWPEIRRNNYDQQFFSLLLLTVLRKLHTDLEVDIVLMLFTQLLLTTVHSFIYLYVNNYNLLCIDFEHSESYYNKIF